MDTALTTVQVVLITQITTLLLARPQTCEHAHRQLPWSDITMILQLQTPSLSISPLGLLPFWWDSYIDVMLWFIVNLLWLLFCTIIMMD